MEENKDREVFAAAGLQALPGWSTSLINRVLGDGASFVGILQADPATLPVPDAAAEELLRWQAGGHRALRQSLERELDRCRNAGVSLITSTSDDYPPLLREISQPPALIYLRGDSRCLALPQLAIVGSRRASRGGLENARQFAQEMAGSGFCITSGLALGIDGAAHRGALEKGRTLAVLGAGWNLCYPRQHADLMEQILDAGGAILSEFSADVPPRRNNFPRRNRIISGLSSGVLVVEAAVKSGSLITARYAMEQGREVFAIPGSIHNPRSRGCHQLIREGATLVETVADIVEQLGGMLGYHAQDSASDQNGVNLNGQQRALLQQIGFDPVDPDSLVERVEMDVATVSSLLVELELLGWIERCDGRVQRSH